MTFEKFQSRVVIEAELLATTPIFIGARADSFKPGAINGSCVKDTYGRPYIPGSSLKGVLRAFLSNLFNDPNDSIVDGKENGKYLKKDQRDKFASPEELAKKIVSDSTPAEKLFGSKVMAGKVKVADAMLPDKDKVTTEVRNGVAIDRDTHTALGDSGALFDTEVVPSGTVFSFIASAENLEIDEADWFSKLLEYFANGNITVGGRSRAGLGNVKLQNITATIQYAVPSGFPIEEKIEGGLNGIKEAIRKCSQN